VNSNLFEIASDLESGYQLGTFGEITFAKKNLTLLSLNVIANLYTLGRKAKREQEKKIGVSKGGEMEYNFPEGRDILFLDQNVDLCLGIKPKSIRSGNSGCLPDLLLPAAAGSAAPPLAAGQSPAPAPLRIRG
jgi:hypothetical protein